MVRRMNTIQCEWNDYAEIAMPREAERVQRRETRRAFYAGYMAALIQITELAQCVDAGSMSREGGAAVMEGVREELARFALLVRDDAD